MRRNTCSSLTLNSVTALFDSLKCVGTLKAGCLWSMQPSNHALCHRTEGRVPVVDAAAQAFDFTRGRGGRGKDTDPLVDSSYLDSFCVYREGSSYGTAGGTHDSACSAPKENGCNFCEEHSCAFVVRYTTLKKRCNRAKPGRQQFCDRHLVR
jgi:hypothetical protein